MKKKIVSSLSALLILSTLGSHAFAGDGEITLIHMGDLHGHLIPRPNARSDNRGSDEGGVARMHTLIKKIRQSVENSLLINTGDTIQGSAEALFTSGQAQVDVLNDFKIDAFAPGNWDFVYGTARFLDLFAGSNAKAPWGTLAANLYYDGEPFADKTGQRVLPPYAIKQVGGLKIGILGFTTDRGPQVVGSAVSKGFRFSKGDQEVAQILPILREQEKVDLVVMISELGLANNIRLAEANPGIDIVLSSDMHEITRDPVVTAGGTVLVEAGQDGTMLGELKLQVKQGKLSSWKWELHRVDNKVAEDRNTAAKVREIRKTFIGGPSFKQHANPFNGTLLPRPIDIVVGQTAVSLHRSNFSNENMPAVIEGSSHGFLTDAFRQQTGADVGAIRGFRYGTHVAAGPIKMEDLYHYIPIGPMIASGTVTGQAIKNQIENAANGSLSPKVADWTGGWLFNFSGLTMDLDPYANAGSRASNIRLTGAAGGPQLLDLASRYSYASYFYRADPALINTAPASDIKILTDEQGQPLDGVEVVVRYLKTLPNQTANPELNRIKLLKALPATKFGNAEVQPLRGAAP